ncbi:hypothetical protein [Halostreptopolyspora alba]|uniref:SIS domain-containing protein n=1 Tax=Halostreptopolyspora alba TaxID=2487137 RepID=A0A3N0E1R4_9ACTN|nr:hypothetical protein EFW17_21430 [Nocardiopsaceae bacterium YIM 96095]
MEPMDARHVLALRQILESTPWLQRAEDLARSLRRTRSPGGLMLVGTPEEEPWHLAAHLSDESRYAGLPQIAPNLVRWSPPPDAPPHLSIGLERLTEARRGETLFVVSPAEEAPASLLERVDDARRTGTTILSLDRGDRELTSLAHDSISLPAGDAPLTLDGLQHLVSSAAGQQEDPSRPRLRDRVSRFLDVVSGPRSID